MKLTHIRFRVSVKPFCGDFYVRCLGVSAVDIDDRINSRTWRQAGIESIPPWTYGERLARRRHVYVASKCRLCGTPFYTAHEIETPWGRRDEACAQCEREGERRKRLRDGRSTREHVRLVGALWPSRPYLVSEVSFGARRRRTRP